MAETSRPGPGRATADEAFSEVKKQVARRNEEAHKAAPGADRQVKWCIKKVSGVNGGISPLNIATVEIEVTNV